MNGATSTTDFPAHATAVTVPLWLMLAVSSIVFIEPAPFDILAAGLCIFFVALGLRMPRNLGDNR